MNLGIFAGGIAQGYSKGLEDQRKQAEEKRKQDAADREDAYRKAVEELPTPDVAYKARVAEYEKSKKQADVESSAAKTAAQVVGNPTIYSQGINLPSAGTAPRSFSDDVAKRGADIGLSAAKPAPSDVRSIVSNGIDAATAMRKEIAAPQQIAQPEAPKAPGMHEWLEFATKRAAIDLRFNKMDGAGIIQLAQVRKQIEDEGMKDALLQIHNGDAQGGINAFNQYGNRRVKLIESKPIEADVGGIKMQTHEVTYEDENGQRHTVNAGQMLNGMRKIENQLDTAFKLMQHRQTAKHQDESLAETRDYHKGVLDHYDRKTSGGGLTVPQQRTNAEIDSAREYVAGLSQDEIQRRTQQYSATGRENPDYDPLLASKVRQAQHRKYGEDADFENVASPPAAAEPDIGARFAADPVMKGHRLGNKTPQGVEVFDASGKLIGHYN